jgi:hypothetical protein
MRQEALAPQQTASQPEREIENGKVVKRENRHEARQNRMQDAATQAANHFLIISSFR